MDSLGCLMSGYFIPHEVLTIILGHVLPHESIMQCRMVCRNWNYIIETESWRYVVKLGKNQRTPYREAEIGKIKTMPWFILHAMCAENSIFGKNFVMTKYRENDPIWSLADPKSPNWRIVPTDNVKATAEEDEVLNNTDFFVIRMKVPGSAGFTGAPAPKVYSTQVIEFPKCGLSNLIYKALRPRISTSLWLFRDAYEEDYVVEFHFRNPDLQVMTAHDGRYPRNSRMLEWEKITMIHVPLRPNVNSLVITHSLTGYEAECEITRILIRIEKPNYLDVDWNSIFNSKLYATVSKLTSKYPLLMRMAVDHRTFGSNLLTPFDNFTRLLAFRESGNFMHGMWYGRPLFHRPASKAMTEDGLWPWFEEGKYFVLYELRYNILLRRFGLSRYIMDDLQPCIEASVDHTKLGPYCRMIVSLQDVDGKILHRKTASASPGKEVSEMLSLTFENYGNGVSYVVFSVERYLSMQGGEKFSTDVGNTTRACRVRALLPQI